MKGAPPSSSVRPGASPMIMRLASRGPVPMTTRWRVAARPHRWHVDISAKSLTSVDENSRNASTEVGENLPGDGPSPRGPLIRTERLVALLSQQHHVVTDAHGVVADVDHQLIHGDHTSDRIPGGVDKYLRAAVEELTGVAIGVSKGHRHDCG